MHFRINADDEPIVEPAGGARLSDDQIWEFLYRLAWKGAGSVGGNPNVAALLLDRDGRYVACGVHLHYGHGHAEANLVAEVERGPGAEAFQGGTVYCTLEPCAHEGKTPSCATLLSQLPIKRVVFGERDPNPKVNGQGAAIIRASGIECIHATAVAPPLEKLTERCMTSLLEGRPFIGLKAATTLDGIMAASIPQKNNITGPRARRYGHWLRRVYDGIVVGSDTVIADNPELTDRSDPDQVHVPYRIVLDPRGRALRHWAGGAACHLLKQHPEKTIWVSQPSTWNDQVIGFYVDELRRAGVHTWSVPTLSGQGLDLCALLPKLHQFGISSLLLEGGRRVWSTFLQQHMVDRIHLFVAMKIWGQQEKHHWTECLQLGQRHIELDSAHCYSLDHELLIESAIARTDEMRLRSGRASDP